MKDFAIDTIAYFFPDYMRLRFSTSDLDLLKTACETETLQLQAEIVSAKDNNDSRVAIDELERRVRRYARARRMIEEVLNEEA